MMLNADCFTPVDDTLIPTGIIEKVDGTPMDFRKPTRIGARISQVGGDPKGYDHNYVLNKTGKELSLAARVEESRSGRIMEMYTTEPGVQFYSGNFLDGTITGFGDVVYNQYHGFCLEAQQKSIVIGRTRGFVDLVFYHRVLKCHVLVDLKVDEFRHEHIGQLNTYVTWYRKHMMAEGDKPPVGLLLCTGKDHVFVEYALAAMDNRLFVSKYQLELPGKDELVRFLEDKRRELGGT